MVPDGATQSLTGSGLLPSVGVASQCREITIHAESRVEVPCVAPQ